MNKTMKIISILMLVVALFTVATTTFAFDTNLIDEVKNQADNSNVNTTGVTTIAGNVLKVVRNVTVVLAVILITVLGIKYMMGSAEEKSGYQKSFVPLIIGIVVVAAATQIATMIFSVF